MSKNTGDPEKVKLDYYVGFDIFLQGRKTF